MTHWSRRLIAKRRDKGWSTAELARRSGVSAARLYKYEKGKTEAPRGDTLNKLAAALDVNELWLSRGVDLSAPAGTEQLSSLRRIPVMSLMKLSSLKRKADLAAAAVGPELIPVSNEVGPHAVALRLDDDSMAPRFPEGSLVVCDPDAAPVPGKYVIAISKKAKRAVFRRYRSLAPGNGKAELLAENHDYPAIQIASEKDGFIVGRAVLLLYRL